MATPASASGYKQQRAVLAMIVLRLVALRDCCLSIKGKAGLAVILFGRCATSGDALGSRRDQ